MKTRAELMDLLAGLGIETEVLDHPAVFTVEEAQRHTGHLPGGHCKNLFLKDKKGKLYLLVCLDEQVVRINAVQKQLGAARLSFGNAELLLEKLGVTPGSVTPLALINDAAREVQPILDRRMLAQEFVNYHPLTNEATVTLRSADLKRLLTHWGYQPIVIDLDALAADAA